MYNAYAAGKRIYLRHPTEEDANGRWHEWFSDEETTKYLSARFWPNTREAQQVFLKTLGNMSGLVLSIVTKKADRHIGVVSLGSINWVHRFAEVALVIGEKEYQKGSYAVETFGLILKIAFNRLNLRALKSGYAASNEASRAIHELFRFTRVGVFKDILYIDGRYDDLVISMLDKESWLKRGMQGKNNP